MALVMAMASEPLFFFQFCLCNTHSLTIFECVYASTTFTGERQSELSLFMATTETV